MPPKKRKRVDVENDAKDDKTVRETATNNGKRKKVLAKKKTAAPSKPAEAYSYWLMKSEPETRIENGVDVKFGIEDLKKCEDRTACWDGVRNYQARNFMRDQMKTGQLMFFYHSNCKEPGIAGICEIVKEGYPDHTQFDKKDIHYDGSSKPDAPKWYMVDVKFIRMLKRYIPLSELKVLHQQHKTTNGPLKDVALFTKARLSVQPLREQEWNYILTLEDDNKH
ncbi:hypothetical protein ScPMuIL_015315 [Solemya velum]